MVVLATDVPSTYMLSAVPFLTTAKCCHLSLINEPVLAVRLLPLEPSVHHSNLSAWLDLTSNCHDLLAGLFSKRATKVLLLVSAMYAQNSIVKLPLLNLKS